MLGLDFSATNQYLYRSVFAAWPGALFPCVLMELRCSGGADNVILKYDMSRTNGARGLSSYIAEYQDHDVSTPLALLLFLEKTMSRNHQGQRSRSYVPSVR